MSTFDKIMMAVSLILATSAIIIFSLFTWTRHIGPARERRRMLAEEQIERDKDDEWLSLIGEGDILVYCHGGEYLVYRDNTGHLFIGGGGGARHYLHGIWRRNLYWKLKERGGPW